jgi:hypothetical protein
LVPAIIIKLTRKGEGGFGEGRIRVGRTRVRGIIWGGIGDGKTGEEGYERTIFCSNLA